MHTIRLGSSYQTYGMCFTPNMVVFLHPMWYCPRHEIAVPLHPDKSIRLSASLGIKTPIQNKSRK